MTSVSLHGRAGGFTTDSSRMGPVDRARRVWEYRRILGLMIKRDVKLRYSDSVLGYVWAVLDPLLMSFVYFIIFTKVFSRGDPAFTNPYMVYLLSGQLAWFWFANAVNSGTKALLSEAQMVRSSNVPREIWVLRGVLSKGVEFVFSLPVLIAFMLVYWEPINAKILLWPLAILVESILLTGIGLLLSAVTVLVRDIDRIVKIVVRVLYYASPVLYSVNEPRLEKMKPVYNFNPMAGILDMLRLGMFPREMDLTRMLSSSLMAVVILAIGVFVFGRLERQVLKEI